MEKLGENTLSCALSLLSLSFESVPESDKKQSKNNGDQEKSVDRQNLNL